MAKKSEAKQFALRKRKRRQWITFIRMIRYGVNNFSRNAWLTIAATAVMTITLLIVFMTLAARNTLVTTVEEIRSKVDISIYVKNDTPQAAITDITQQLNKLSSVKNVSYVSSEEARTEVARKNADDQATLQALNEATNKLPGTIRVNVEDINETSQLEDFVKTDGTLKKYLSPDTEPSFAGPRRAAIKTIGRTIDFADKVGLVASIVFIIISSLIVFNTIRMAIYNRKEEIQMMKLIGADRSFIRGPFIVEAIVYGLIAAVIATGLGLLALVSAKDKLLSYQIAIQPTIDFVTLYIGFILLGMIVLGGLIGVGSALLATRRYLKL